MIIRDEKRKRKNSLEESEEGKANSSVKSAHTKEKKSKKKKSKSHKDIQPSSSDSSLSGKREKKKKKITYSSDNETESDENEKYVAYKLKKHKKSKKHKKNKKERKPTSMSNSDHDEFLLDKSSKVKSIISHIDSSTEDVYEPAITISSKPKLYKQSKKTDSSLSIDSDTAQAREKKSKKSGLKVSKSNQNQLINQDKSKIEIIVPEVSVAPQISFDESAKVDSPDPDMKLTSINSFNLSSTEISPLIVEANLKKPSKFYVPDILKDDDDLFIDAELEKHMVPEVEIQEPEISSKENFKENIKKQTNSEKLSPKIGADQNSTIDIPTALQEFYNEVSKGFEALANKPKNKDFAKKRALTTDESLEDYSKLREIVSKNDVINNAPSITKIKAQFFSLENKVILVLKPETQFSFLGKFKLKVLYGAVQVYGSVFYSANSIKPVDIYSPRGYSSISISTYDLEDSYDKENLWDSLTSEGVDRSMKTKLHDAISKCKRGWSVILLENFENTLTNFLNNYSSLKLFPKIENLKNTWCDPKRAEYVLQANFQFSMFPNEISIYPQWENQTTDNLISKWKSKKSLCTMVVGGKSVGKSTTVRYLINKFLRHSKKVVLLDLDPGQAELTPPACISLSILEEPLLGPNFTHIKSPFHQYYLEDVSVVNCITYYIECVKKLVEILKSDEKLKELPVIVNTMGFCKGIGVDICIFLIKLIEPSNIIQIFSKRPRNNYDFQLSKDTINKHTTSSVVTDGDAVIMNKISDYELHYIPSLAEGKRQFDAWNMEPRQQRELALLSYLSQIIENADEKSFCNLASNSLNNIIPFKLPFSSFYVSLIKSSTSPTHILAAMNGNIVSLCGIDLDDETSKADREALKYPMVVIKPPPSTFYGLGIVRGIDMKSKCIFINTPLDESQLTHVNFLAGCSPVPFSLLNSNNESNNAVTPYKADRGKLPTSRETRRGYFRVDQSKKE